MFVISIVLGAVGMNICYTFCYVLEFFRGTDDPGSRWPRGGRTFCFVAGIFIGMFLALWCGWNIAQVEWSNHAKCGYLPGGSL